MPVKVPIYFMQQIHHGPCGDDYEPEDYEWEVEFV